MFSPLSDYSSLLCVPPGCSRTYEQAYGYLKSPDWPNIYPHDVDCTIILMAPQNNSISLFFNSFNLESHSTCSYDYLEVRTQTV